MLVPPHHQGVICYMHLGRGVDSGHGEQLARKLRHEHHHGRVCGEPLGTQVLPKGRPHLRQVTGGRSRALELDVGPHIPEDRGGRDLRRSSQHFLPLLRAMCDPHAAHMPACGMGERSRWGSEVDPCWIWRLETSICRTP